MSANQVSDIGGSTPTPSGRSEPSAWRSAPCISAAPGQFTDASRRSGDISLKGPGTGAARVSAGRQQRPRRVILPGTTSASAFTILPAATARRPGGLTITGDLKLAHRKDDGPSRRRDISGVAAEDSIPDAAGSSASAAPAGRRHHARAGPRLSITTASAIKSLKAEQWTDTDTTPDSHHRRVSVGTVTAKAISRPASPPPARKVDAVGGPSVVPHPHHRQHRRRDRRRRRHRQHVFAGVRNDLAAPPVRDVRFH